MNIWKLCFDTMQYAAYVVRPCLYQSGVPEDRRVCGGLHEDDVSWVETHWSS